MQRESGIKWLFMDLNSYFASVEQQENPMLRGKPVAVVPMETDYTCAIAASYEAKAYGVTTGTIITDAKKMCPHLHCTLAKHDLYVAYHHKIIEEVINHTPINKIWSIDELSSRLPPNKRNIDAAHIIARNIKAGIHHNVGEAIHCSIGFAPNSLLAKIACEMNKPDGLTILTQEALPGPLLNLKLTDLPGIGKNMARRLSKSGITSIQDFWDIEPAHARKIWGSVQGERFWYLLHGYDIESQPTKPSMIGHSRVLDPKLRTPEKARLILRKLVMKAAHRLRKKELNTRTISVSLRTKSGYKTSDTLSIQATQDPFTLLQYTDTLWRNIMQNIAHNTHADDHNATIKKISVVFSNLVTPDMITDDLFLSAAHNEGVQSLKNEALTQALEKLQHKYKKEVVSLGIPPKTSAGYVGTKIAFARVPDTEEFWS
tara:strand:+ start:12079 stop:13368 length:1290 start_codon:yes stop_codon:yes gene_type:complete